MRDLRKLAERIVAADSDSRRRAYEHVADGDIEAAEDATAGAELRKALKDAE